MTLRSHRLHSSSGNDCLQSRAIFLCDVDAPVVSCPRTEAHLYQRNAFITCEVRAEPDVFVLYWVIDHNGTTLVAGQVVREYWTLVLVSPFYSLRDFPLTLSLYLCVLLCISWRPKFNDDLANVRSSYQT